VNGDERGGAALRRFHAKVIGALGHDLRTPLGTIVNCAAVLEGDPAPAAEEVRDIADRVRRQAMRVIDVAQLLSDALFLAASPPESATGEANSLLQSILETTNHGIRWVPAPMRPDGPPRVIEVDPRVVGFAAQAWLAVEGIVRPELPRDARLRVERLGERLRIELAFDGRSDLPMAAVPVDEYVRDLGVKIPPTRKFALEIAEALLDCRGGELTLSGRPGRDPALRLEFAQDRRGGR